MRAVWVLLLLVWGALPGRGAEPFLTQWVHEGWQNDRNLPLSSVFCFAQDADGFLWMGTEEGLVRFDGAGSKIFNQRSTPQLRHNFVSSLLATRDGSLWVGTRTGGLMRYRDEQFEAPIPELVDSKVFALAEARDGAIFIGTTNTLYRFAGGKLDAIDSGSKAERVSALCASANGAIWVGYSNGDVARFADGRMERVQPFTNERRSTVSGLAEEPGSGAIWVAHDGDGLFRLSGTSFDRVTLLGSRNEYIQALLVDPEGTVWAGTQHDGIVRWHNGQVSVFNAQDGLTTDDTISLFHDGEGGLWAGTLFGGVHRLYQGPVITFGRREGLPADSVSCVLETKPGVLWIGTRDCGLYEFSGGIFRPIPTPGLTREIRALLRTDSGETWVGAKDTGGLLRFRSGGEFSRLTKEDGLVANDATAFFQSRQGPIWIGTQRDGVSVYDPALGKVVRTFTNSPVRCYIRCFTEDRNGTIWIGTQNGLVKFSGGNLQSIDLGVLSNETIRTMLIDEDNALWLGTRDAAVLRLGDKGTFHFEGESGLTHVRIFQFLRSGKDLWMAGNRGIETVPLNQLQEVADGRRPHVSSHIFTQRDGLRTSECGGDGSPGAIIASDGSLWFATRRGLSRVNPGQLPAPASFPTVRIKDVTLDSEPVMARHFHAVPAGTTRIQFRYTAPALRNAGEILFRYKLEGFDKSWIEAGREREAVYSRLPPGHYTFAVAASNGEGAWPAGATTLAFAVAPQFYQTTWFYAVALLAGVAGARGLYRWSLAGMRRRNERLEHLVQIRTRELEEEVAHRKLAEEEQVALNSVLEVRVQERTAELAASEGRLRRVVDSGMVGILFWNADGRILDANETFLKMIGFSREELEAELIFWKQLTPPEHLELDAAALEEIRRTGVCTPFEKEYIRKDGTRFPVLLGGASLADNCEEGVCFVLDISERKASEEQVRQLAHSLEARVQERTQELARINAQLAGEAQERKKVAIALSSFSQLGQKLHGTRTETDAAGIISLTAKSLIPHDICSIELYDKQDKLYPVVLHQSQISEPLRSSISVPIRNGSRVIGVIGLQSSASDAFTAHDANTLQALGDYCGGALDRIHAEEARRETERRFVAFMTNAPALAWMKNAELQYVFTNPMFQRFLGFSAMEIDGKTDVDLWPPNLAARIQANDLHVLQTESTVETQETLRRADEEIRTLLTFRFPFTTATGQKFIAGMAIDISDQKQAEEALHLLPQRILEAQEQERHRLARELHDGVNQAIASAKFRIQTAENQIVRGDNKWQESCRKSKEMLDTVLQQVRRLSHNLRPGELDDLGLLAAARTAFLEFEERTGIAVHFQAAGFQERLDPTVESTFYRIIQEALTNIEKHSSATLVNVNISQDEDGLALEISDNGIGFDSTEAANRRSGLGLLHMRERANLVGAGISVETAPGNGVRIVIRVPAEAHENYG